MHNTSGSLRDQSEYVVLCIASAALCANTCNNAHSVYTVYAFDLVQKFRSKFDFRCIVAKLHQIAMICCFC